MTFLSQFYHWWHFDWGGIRAPWSLPGYAYNCNFNAICDFVCFFAGLPSRACESNTNGSILYDHAKYVISVLVKVKIVLKSSCNLKL